VVHNWKVREIRPQRRTLEELFVRITQQEEEVLDVVEVKESTEHRAIADIFFLDSEGKVVARMENYESVIDAGLNQAFRRNRLSQPVSIGSV